MNLPAVDFSDLDADLDAATRSASSANSLIESPCMACAGSGKKRYGYVNITYYPCPTCKGTGKVSAQRLQRIAASKKATKTRAENLTKNITVFKSKHPAAVQWMVENRDSFEFAANMHDALMTYGRLSEKQLAAVLRCIARRDERRAANAVEAEKNKVDVSEGANHVRSALEKAAANKLRKPMLRAGDLTLSLAPAGGKNPGCVYVKASSEYVGKIDANGMFFAVRTCTAEQKAMVVEVMTNPLEAAIKYGRMTGRCSCCGKRLDNAKSIELGIGPICREKYFGGM